MACGAKDGSFYVTVGGNLTINAGNGGDSVAGTGGQGGILAYFIRRCRNAQPRISPYFQAGRIYSISSTEEH